MTSDYDGALGWGLATKATTAPHSIGIQLAPSPESYLNRSSNAFFALFVGPDGLLLAAVLVWRSTVVRGENSAQLLRSSLGATRAGMRAFSVHSHRTLVSNDTH